MRSQPLWIIEPYRIVKGDFASRPGDLHGMFQRARLRIISSGPQDGWEHVSVSLQHRVPSWNEMCTVKDWFWGDEEPVMQLHPPKSDHVNFHPYCLHLWKPIDSVIPLPPSYMVGPK